MKEKYQNLNSVTAEKRLKHLNGGSGNQLQKRLVY